MATTPALMIQATGSNAGKSTIVAGLARVLVRRGLRTVALNDNQENAVAARLYERLGFVRHCAFCEGVAEH